MNPAAAYPALLLALAGCAPALGLHGPPSGSRNAVEVLGAGAFAGSGGTDALGSVRLAHPLAEREVAGGRARGLGLVQMSMGYRPPPEPATTFPVAIDPRVGLGGEFDWGRLQAHLEGSLGGFVVPTPSLAIYSAVVGAAASLGVRLGPLVLFASADAAAGRTGVLSIFNNAWSMTETASGALGLADEVGPVTLFLEGGRGVTRFRSGGFTEHRAPLFDVQAAQWLGVAGLRVTWGKAVEPPRTPGS